MQGFLPGRARLVAIIKVYKRPYELNLLMGELEIVQTIMRKRTAEQAVLPKLSQLDEPCPYITW